jgi:hypothetical protein
MAVGIWRFERRLDYMGMSDMEAFCPADQTHTPRRSGHINFEAQSIPRFSPSFTELLQMSLALYISQLRPALTSSLRCPKFCKVSAQP